MSIDHLHCVQGESFTFGILMRLKIYVAYIFLDLNFMVFKNSDF